MRRRLLPLLLLPCLLLTGCWQDAAIAEEEPYPEDLTPQEEEVIPLPEALSLPWYNGVTLDPITCPDGTQQTVAALLYEGLYALDPSFTPQPRLCAEAQRNDDATVWTLTLRQDVRFSDGSALRARDVVASLQRAKESERYGGRLAAVTSITESRGRVILRLRRPNANLPALLDIPIVKSGTQDKSAPTGTGPYVLASDAGGSFLTANANWWQGKTLPTESVRLVDCADESSVRYQFSSHAAQLLVSDQAGASPLRSGSRYDIAEVDTTILHCLLLNQKTELLRSAAVRRCLSLGIDRESLVDACLSGHGRPAQFPLSPASPLYPADLEEPYRYEDFEDALDRAGLNTGETRSLTLLVCSRRQLSRRRPFRLRPADHRPLPSLGGVCGRPGEGGLRPLLRRGKAQRRLGHHVPGDPRRGPELRRFQQRRRDRSPHHPGREERHCLRHGGLLPSAPPAGPLPAPVL